MYVEKVERSCAQSVRFYLNASDFHESTLDNSEQEKNEAREWRAGAVYTVQNALTMDMK